MEHKCFPVYSRTGNKCFRSQKLFQCLIITYLVSKKHYFSGDIPTTFLQDSKPNLPHLFLCALAYLCFEISPIRLSDQSPIPISPTPQKVLGRI